MRRGGFTLIELLVVILIIGILGGLFYGAIQRASGVSRIVHTKSTIAKLNASLMDRWDSYRTRRLPINPNTILSQIKATSGTAYPQLQARIAAMSARRIAASGGSLHAYTNPPVMPFDPLSVPWNAPPLVIGGQPKSIYPNADLVAAVRLLAMREIMRYEMPQHIEDFVDTSGSAPWNLRWPEVLAAPPAVATTYLAQINAAAAGDPSANPPRPPATLAQISSNDSAECLYMILTIGSTDSGLFGEQLPNQDIGDVDGDGLPEFQDAWPVASNSFSPRGQANSPIDFLRWAPGYISELQDSPTAPNAYEFSIANHDFFDPMKLDAPDGPSGLPRGFRLMPLIFSAGPDGIWGVNQNVDQGPPTAPKDADPYATDANGILPGATAAGADDDITNHSIDTRTGA